MTYQQKPCVCAHAQQEEAIPCLDEICAGEDEALVLPKVRAELPDAAASLIGSNCGFDVAIQELTPQCFNAYICSLMRCKIYIYLKEPCKRLLDTFRQRV